MNNDIIVISGFSGAGKDTIAKSIHDLYGFNFVVSHSTRPMRPNESQGDPYIFISDNEMCSMAFNNELVEGRCYKTIDGNWFYAVHKNQIKNNKQYVVVLDVLGYREFKKHFGNRVFGVFIDVSNEDRLERASSQRLDFNVDEWNRRLKDDMKQFNNEKITSEYEYIIKNNNYKETLQNISSIINERNHIKNKRGKKC